MPRMARPGELWEARDRIAIYPADNGLPAMYGINPGEILGPGSAAGLYSVDDYIQVLYQERVWEINSSLFLNGVMRRCQ